MLYLYCICAVLVELLPCSSTCDGPNGLNYYLQCFQIKNDSYIYTDVIDNILPHMIIMLIYMLLYTPAWMLSVMAGLREKQAYDMWGY